MGLMWGLRWRLLRLRRQADQCASRGLQNEVRRLREKAARLAQHAKSSVLIARYQNLWGEALFWQGETTAARQAFERALEKLQSTSARAETIQVLLNLAQVANWQGRLQAANGYLEEASRLSPTPAQLCRVQEARGELECARGNFHRARVLLEQARQMARGQGQKGREGWLLYALAQVDCDSGYLTRALEQIEQAEKLWAGRELLGRPQALRLRARVERRRGQLGQAQPHFLSALQLFSAMQHAEGIAASQSGLAGLALQANNTTEAESLLDEAAAGYRRMDYRRRQLAMLLTRVDLHRMTGNLAWARKRCEEALGQSRELGDQYSEAEAKWRLGDMEVRVGGQDSAQPQLLTALELFRQNGCRLGEAQVLLSLAQAGAPDSESQPWLAQALASFQESGCWQGQAQALLMQAQAARNLGQMEEARNLYQRAGQFYQRIDSKPGLAQVALGLGDVERLRGERPASAMVHYDNAQRLFHMVGDRLGEASVRRARAQLLMSSDAEAAREQYQATLGLLGEYDIVEKAHVLLGLGDLDSQAGNYETARQNLMLARELYQRAGLRLGWAHSMRKMGHLDLERGQLDTARQHFEFALELYEQLQDGWGLGKTHLALGALEQQLQNHDEAARHFMAAEEIYRRVQHRGNLGRALLGRAGIERELRRYDSARGHYLEARTHFQASAELSQEQDALRQLGDLEMAAGQVQRAMQYYNELRSLSGTPQSPRPLTAGSLL